ncbi:hypothetical protein [Anaerotruncus rubiinfantis]|uniref:hypothetical protein n=1 Tax=Anaerotruncus rubiinfantis TaxID=1720200 RepID=UPI00082A270B|nr:hypothetical protein [Anaerotruncus rubiinfantis]
MNELANQTPERYLNCLAGIESERIYNAMVNDDQEPYPFHLMWLLRMVDELSGIENEAVLKVILSTLYESLDADLPSDFPPIVESHHLSEFAVELIEDLLDIAEIHFTEGDE